jgi:hypothetical protein
MHPDPSDLQYRALILYQASPDPLLLDAIRVLQDPEDPSYEAAATMIEHLEELQNEF